MEKGRNRGSADIGQKNRWKQWWPAAAAVAVVVAVALLDTRDLPWKQVYEVRYEFKVRDYTKNVEGVERVLGTLPLHDNRWTYEWLESQDAVNGVDLRVKQCGTGKVAMVVRSGDSTLAAGYAADLYAALCDTVTRYGENSCRKREDSIANVIASRVESEIPISQEAVDCLEDQKAELEDSGQGWRKYITLLNQKELPQAHKTMDRKWFVLWAALAALGLCIAVNLLRLPSKAGKHKNGADECAD